MQHLRPDVDGLVVDGEGTEERLLDGPLAAVVVDDELVVLEELRQLVVADELAPVPATPSLGATCCPLLLRQERRPRGGLGRSNNTRVITLDGGRLLQRHRGSHSRELTVVLCHLLVGEWRRCVLHACAGFLGLNRPPHTGVCV